jgi:hypothetical protein
MQAVVDKYKKRALSVDAFCDLYSVGRTLAYAELTSGRLKSITIGRKRLIPSEDAESWFSSFKHRSQPIAV